MRYIKIVLYEVLQVISKKTFKGLNIKPYTG
uniref:Uncharacterized protein n=1 Tax=Myoviridae sp. ctJ2i1 TaxID=2825079 RepID=A0A8S5V1N2_9CAUD|nr:MAG TPA: hypothetical protein [Myoviridae sp. ctJ2i1]